MPSNPSIAVIGGGITGLTAAYSIARKNRPVRLFEAAAQPGGAIRSERTADGWLIETGPNTVLAKTRQLELFVERLGLTPRRVPPNPHAKKRFLVRDGKMLALPSSPLSAITTKLFSFDLKKRIARDYLFTRRPIKRDADIPLAQLAREHYGNEFIDYALNPMVAGIYAGDPEKLSARHAMPFIWDAERTHGSIIRGQLAQARARRAAGAPKSSLLSFKNGLQELTDSLAAQLPRSAIELGAHVSSIARVKAPYSNEPRWEIRWTRDGAEQSELFSHVILAISAEALARLSIAPNAENGEFYTPLAQLSEIESPPLASLFLGYKREQIAHPLDGFGMLVPEVEKLPFLGVLFSSSLFAGRTPPGHVALTVMIGGTRQPGLASLPEQQLIDLVTPSLEKLLGVRGAPVFQKLTAHEHAIPQYNLGYGDHLALMDEFEQTHPGLVIAGNVRDGIAVPNCTASGETRAAKLMEGWR